MDQTIGPWFVPVVTGRNGRVEMVGTRLARLRVIREGGVRRGMTGLVLAGCVLGGAAQAATLEVCRAFDMAMPPTGSLLVPAGSLYRDDGRADDPLAAFGNDRWQLRLVTVTDVVIASLQQCVRVQVRATSDSPVKAVSIADNRNLVYAGSDRLIDRPNESEELLTTKARVLDQVP